MLSLNSQHYFQHTATKGIRLDHDSGPDHDTDSITLNSQPDHHPDKADKGAALGTGAPSAPGRISYADIQKFIKEAIKKGDKSATDLETQPDPPAVDRRALIVAPQYHGSNNPLYDTLRDAYNVYLMLLDHGYKEENICILVEGADLDSLPNRKNILRSLEWLVTNARDNDYRFFHFSGHGGAVQTSKGDGKQVLEITEDGKKAIPGDPELDNKNPSAYTRLEGMEIGEDRLKYYKDFILTSKDRWDSDRIYDSELNSYMSRLPENCKLTCLVDACHSGRMFDCGVKLAGGGFRGIMTSNSSEKPSLPASSEIPATTKSNVSGEAPNLVRQAPSNPAQILHTLINNKKYTIVPSLISAPTVVLSETLSEEEKKRDTIKADVLAWSACHERQLAQDRRYGVFTKAFANTVKEMPKDHPWTVEMVFNKVNKAIEDLSVSEAENQKYSFLQYAQIWTSIGSRSEAEAIAKFAEPFVF